MKEARLACGYRAGETRIANVREVLIDKTSSSAILQFLISMSRDETRSDDDRSTLTVHDERHATNLHVHLIHPYLWHSAKTTRDGCGGTAD
jgi:hypothetical protein